MAVNDDINFQKYMSLLRLGELEKYKGQYLAFVDGKFIDHDSSKESLLTKIRKTYGDRPRFITQIADSEEIIDIPSPLEIQD